MENPASAIDWCFFLPSVIDPSCGGSKIETVGSNPTGSISSLVGPITPLRGGEGETFNCVRVGSG